MEIDKALHQIGEIHERLTHTQVFRGYRAAPIACSGALALLAGALQQRLVGLEPTRQFVYYWIAVAVICAATAGGGIVRNYLVLRDPLVRRQTRTVVGQLLPSLVAGLLVTIALALPATGGIVLLPGLWTILFSLGIFASRPHLPRNIGWVALFYLVAGALMLAGGALRGLISPWGLGLTFGIGQVCSGLVLYWDLERNGGGARV
ncbi:hypothetical protein ACFL34_00830 [Candidatus Sumerlaeota bacterium]